MGKVSLNKLWIFNSVTLIIIETCEINLVGAHPRNLHSLKVSNL